MKLQVLNSSFGKVLAAVAIAFIICSAARAHAQQGQWGGDSCYYAASQNGQWVRQGCMMGGTIYRDDATKVITDLRTRISFFQQQDGRILILTTAGWMDAQAYVAQVAAGKRSRDPNFVASYGGGIVGGPNYNTKTITLGALPQATGYPQLDQILERMTRCPMCLPDNVVYAEQQ